MARFLPHVAIVDLRLPIVSGWDLARLVGEMPILGHPRLIALSGLATTVDRVHSMIAGFEAHLAKPVRLADLIGTIETDRDDHGLDMRAG
jgi:CheY-like chemotaxis protein